MKEENLGSTPEDSVENLKAAEGKNIAHHIHNPGAADHVAGEHTARGRYGEAEETLEDEGSEAGNLK